MLSNSKDLSTVHPDVGGFTLEGRKHAVLCIHGFTATPQTFTELGKEIHEQLGYHVHAPLLSGHGKYAEDLNEVSYKQWIHDVKSEFKTLNKSFSQIHLVGLSMGGTLCQILAQKYPGNIRSISMMAPALRFSNKWEHSPMHIIKFVPKIILNTMIRTKHNKTKGHVSYDHYSMTSVVQVFKLLRYCEKRLQQSSLPCFIQTPTRDQVTDPISSKILKNYYQNCELVFYDDVAHVMVCSHRKEEIFSKIVDWIERHS